MQLLTCKNYCDTSKKFASSLNKPSLMHDRSLFIRRPFMDCECEVKHINLGLAGEVVKCWRNQVNLRIT